MPALELELLERDWRRRDARRRMLFVVGLAVLTQTMG
jgi:hypothetical protein